MPRDKRRNPGWLKKREVIARLKKKFGKRHHKRIREGVSMVAEFWRPEDGSAGDFAKFCETYFITDKTEFKEALRCFERNFEQVFGISLELYRILQRPRHLDTGPITKLDKLFARVDPFSKASAMLFDSKVAFFALLNFASYSSNEVLELEDKLSRKKWIECRLTDSVRNRLPEKYEKKILDASEDAENYISDYNIFVNSLMESDGKPIFTENKKLNSHWGLRDEIKAQYYQPDGYEKQAVLYEMMKKIILQEIPKAVVNNPNVRWDLARNKVFSAETGEEINSDAESDERYAHLQNNFLAEKATDRYYSRDSIERAFMDGYEMPESLVKAILLEILTSPLAKKVARVIKNQLGRRLAPFDIWYNKFVNYDEKKLDPIVSQKYPSPAAFQADIPNILMRLGFSPEKAKFIASKIQVDACRGSGHAWQAGRREDKELLRTRFSPQGMNFQEFKTAMHELGHTTEQAMSLRFIDNVLLAGVADIGFSEAFAFIFEDRALDMLGAERNDPSEKDLKILKRFWSTFEIAGVALVDMRIWRWLYKNKNATPEEIKNAVCRIAKSVWNKYFAPIFGIRNEYILAIYSHIIEWPLYLPNYPIGYVVSFQILDYCKDKDWVKEMERMCKIGCLSPNAWLKIAVGTPLSLKPLMQTTKEALERISEK
jgi:hypothetical protein